MRELIIRNENEKNYREVEEITREAFWNLYVPGCNEHYLVHQLRDSADFISELDFVAVLEDKIVGNIMFSKSYIIDSENNRFDTLTFGPLSVLPSYQHQKIGTALVKHAIEKASQLGYSAIFIYGYPDYYQRFGFRPAKDFGITNGEGRYPMAHMALELQEGSLNGVQGKAYESDVFQMSEQEAEEFDREFSPKEKQNTESQDRFAKMVTAYF